MIILLISILISVLLMGMISTYVSLSVYGSPFKKKEINLQSARLYKILDGMLSLDEGYVARPAMGFLFKYYWAMAGGESFLIFRGSKLSKEIDKKFKELKS